ncbi:MAG: GntR family transcriptional regulator [Deltaproteobacteria bacterium]|nr:GntR family transcriptional regulator [Deltaproteobacteria bacterium]
MMREKNLGRQDYILLNARLAFLIQNQILRGQLEPGERLPNEEVLASKYKVSRITVRAALSRLEASGLIVRNRAKGTFVSENIPMTKQNIVSGGIYDIVRAAQKYQVKCLGIKIVKIADTRIAKDLRTFFKQSNQDEIGLIQRVRLLEKVPIYYLENFLPVELANKISIEELSEKPLLEILKKKAGVKIERGEMYIEAVPAELDIAEILKTQIFEPLIYAQVYYWYPSGGPFETANLFMRPDYFKYRVDLSPEGFEKI